MASPGDIIVCGGITALVYARGKTGLTVMRASAVKGTPSHRADVRIPGAFLSTISGPMKVCVAQKYQISGAAAVVIGQIDTATRASVLRAVALEKASSAYEVVWPADLRRVAKA